MPLYTYQCSCGLRFEASASMSEHSKPKPCPICGQKASRKMPENINGVFLHTVTGPEPQNTGISDLDAHIDRVIGRSAVQGWAAHTARVDAKRELLAVHPDATGYDISQNPDGTFRVMERDEGQVVKTARQDAINILAMRSEQQEKAASS